MPLADYDPPSIVPRRTNTNQHRFYSFVLHHVSTSDATPIYEMQSQVQTAATNLSTPERWLCPSMNDDELGCFLQAVQLKAKCHQKQWNDIAAHDPDYAKNSESWSVTKKPSSRGQASETSDWTILEFVGSSFDDTLPRRECSPSRTMHGKGKPPCSEELQIDEVQRALGGVGFPMHLACLDILDDQRLERVGALGLLKAMGLDQAPRQVPHGSRCSMGHPDSGPDGVVSSTSVNQSPNHRKQHSDAESLRILESCTPASCTPRRRRVKSRLEALSDAESLKVLEYWTQKQSVEKSWA